MEISPNSLFRIVFVLDEFNMVICQTIISLLLTKEEHSRTNGLREIVYKILVSCVLSNMCERRFKARGIENIFNYLSDRLKRRILDILYEIYLESANPFSIRLKSSEASSETGAVGNRKKTDKLNNLTPYISYFLNSGLTIFSHKSSSGPERSSSSSSSNPGSLTKDSDSVECNSRVDLINNGFQNMIVSYQRCKGKIKKKEVLMGFVIFLKIIELNKELFVHNLADGGDAIKEKCKKVMFVLRKILKIELFRDCPMVNELICDIIYQIKMEVEKYADGKNIEVETSVLNLLNTSQKSSESNGAGCTKDSGLYDHSPAHKSCQLDKRSTVSSKFLEASKSVGGFNTQAFSSSSRIHHNKVYFENCIKNDFREIGKYLSAKELEVNELSSEEWYLFDRINKRFSHLSIKPFDLLEEASKDVGLNDTAINLQLFDATIEHENPP